jgi:OmpA-OmpF porin, OOP family
MKQALFIITVSFFINSKAPAQANSYKQPATIGIHFVFNDFATAQEIRSSSLATVLNNNRFGKLKDMAQGLALSYGQGISDYFDFSSMLSGSFLNYPIPGKEDDGGQFLLLEGDASIRGKMFSDKYWFVPYVQVGLGVSKYQGYWGTFIPAGVGLQMNFFDEAYLMINSQYRIAISESTNYHFIHSIGLVGNIGSRD